MGKLIGIVAVILIIVLGWQGVQFFSNVKEPIRQGEMVALNYLKENIELPEIIHTDFYHGTESYYVFQGIDELGEELIIWISSTLDSYLIKPKNEGISFDDALLFTKQELNPKQLISIKLGMENKVPLYEIIYKDQQERYSYYFISFKDGSYLKHHHLGL
ncbi:DUF5590 domain-containing protein [Anaerobacillus isosaccharinicus]|uniref:DUF5590 domain-containing protein n=1 Tax=Anaerobacillus isosaccharinicus TaxID=1532552 RepID=A0A1S2KX14_9BACI|nr:DUF5590 domain-containing protein [Anaerobacillus isosaccharinicus]MBA5585897.1 DUF5590 domain-containing protein [Anaerobacillus isosaccharinicus]QOY35813.1 DUF5590 domain-containing protein [Anaerobacillus isosaccharinicus]